MEAEYKVFALNTTHSMNQVDDQLDDRKHINFNLDNYSDMFQVNALKILKMCYFPVIIRYIIYLFI